MNTELKINFYMHVAFFGFILTFCGVYGLFFAPAAIAAGKTTSLIVAFIVGIWTLIGGTAGTYYHVNRI